MEINKKNIASALATAPENLKINGNILLELEDSNNIYFSACNPSLCLDASYIGSHVLKLKTTESVFNDILNNVITPQLAFLNKLLFIEGSRDDSYRFFKSILWN